MYDVSIYLSIYLCIYLCIYLFIYLYIFISSATHVQNEDGSLILLNAKNLYHRQGIAKRLLAPNKIGSSNGATKKVQYDE